VHGAALEDPLRPLSDSDVAVFFPTEPEVRYPETPPLVSIEILSPEDKLTGVREKLEIYRTWGVPHVWLVDPYSRRMYTCDAGLMETATLHVPELNVALTSDQVFG
jgi:Uma2 family endonuclease